MSLHVITNITIFIVAKIVFNHPELSIPNCVVFRNIGANAETGLYKRIKFNVFRVLFHYFNISN